MLQESQDFRIEADELHDFVKDLPAEDWEKPTGFKEWTPWDIIAHLHFFDGVSLASVDGEEAFANTRDAYAAQAAQGMTNAEIARKHFGASVR